MESENDVESLRGDVEESNETLEAQSEAAVREVIQRWVAARQQGPAEKEAADLVMAIKGGGLDGKANLPLEEVVGDLRKGRVQVAEALLAYWEGEDATGKLGRLAHEVLNLQPNPGSEAVAQLAVHLARALALVRPVVAGRLLEVEGVDQFVALTTTEAVRDKVARGLELQGEEPEVKRLWSRVERSPDGWDTKSGRLLLQRLPEILQRMSESGQTLLLAVVPEIWRDLYQAKRKGETPQRPAAELPSEVEREAADSVPEPQADEIISSSLSEEAAPAERAAEGPPLPVLTAPPDSGGRFGRFWTGLAAGLVAGYGAAIWMSPRGLTGSSNRAEPMAMFSSEEAAALTSASNEEEPESKVEKVVAALTSVAESPVEEKLEPVVASVEEPVMEAADEAKLEIAAAPVVPEPDEPVDAPPSESERSYSPHRMAVLSGYRVAFPQSAALVSKVRNGSQDQALSALKAVHRLPEGEEKRQTLWALMLDPSEDPEVQRAVSRFVVAVLEPASCVEMFELLLEEGEPQREENADLAEALLSVHRGDWPSAVETRMTALLKTQK
ncbi:MAG: hypothetical protein KDK99_04525 [Verrucomicrobiales bacterium]|nr:hypothetical protein [Verrucomicrobiales bacterium]